MPMPMPQKRRRRRRRSPGSGSSRRRIGEELSGSVVKSEINSTAYGADRGVSFPRYKLLLTSRLDGLELPPSADGDDPGSFYRPDHPSDEILKALTRRSFLDDEMLDALVEYQIQKCLIDGTQGQDSGEFHSASETHGRASGNFDSADVAMASVDLGDDICDEDFLKDCEKLWSSATPVGAKLNNRRQDELYLRHARFRIKAFLLLKGKTIDKLDDAALDRKYPPNLVAEHSYFLDYDRYDLFGWFFDSDLCKLASLTDYQRLVLFNDSGEYENWDRYRLFYNTPETDRDYLLYWKALTEKIKWIEAYIHRGKNSDDWENMWMKAKYQAIRIATNFDNIHLELASLGFMEFIWRTRIHVLFWKDLDGVFFEIWKLVIKDQVCFKKALKEVYDLGKFPSQELFMKAELDGKFRMEKQFLRCTVGITKESLRKLVGLSEKMSPRLWDKNQKQWYEKRRAKQYW